MNTPAFMGGIQNYTGNRGKPPELMNHLDRHPDDLSTDPQTKGNEMTSTYKQLKMDSDESGPRRLTANLLLEMGSGFTALPCPVCKHQDVHLTGVAMSGGDPDDPESKMVETLGKCPGLHAPVGMEEPSRLNEDRPVFTLYGFCEGGHDFALNLKQHKGQTYWSVQQINASPIKAVRS